MDKSLWNRITRLRQVRTLFGFLGLLFLMGFLGTVFLREGSAKHRAPLEAKKHALIDESLTQSIPENAMVIQQGELESLKVQIKALRESIKAFEANQKQEKAKAKAKALIKAHQSKPATTNDPTQSFLNASQASLIKTAVHPWQNPPILRAQRPQPIHHVSFRPHKTIKRFRRHRLNYVPANTSVRAVILGGADADASVNGQMRNNGVMLFKLLDNGVLPNGQHSKLKGCRVSGSAFGDISSERAFATLYKLSCARRGEAIVDKAVTGWVFFNGKVGVKGVPLMRDNKVLQWAGISGALTGLSEAAQYAQSIQQFATYGASSVVPSTRVAPYAGFGGASKASDVLSQYYVKRAEQYHPVIQVGAGNIVTIVFKDGFFLDNDALSMRRRMRIKPPIEPAPDFNVPHAVLEQLDASSKTPWQTSGESS